MGRRGPLPKASDRAQGHRSRELTVITGGAADRPIPPAARGWLPATRKAWKVYWTSELAGLTEATDEPSVRRLFWLYNQRERSAKIVDDALVVRGSTGQIRVNPLADYVLKLDSQILRLENELGLTPSARARLGIDVSNAIRSLEDLAREAEQTVEAVDPRFIDIEG